MTDPNEVHPHHAIDSDVEPVQPNRERPVLTANDPLYKSYTAISGSIICCEIVELVVPNVKNANIKNSLNTYL